ncbi:MAG: hypothetical protein ABEK10_00330 [Candidatus Nanosalina sp.]
MSVQTGKNEYGDELYFLGVSEEDIEFEGIQGVLHGGYQQASGIIDLEDKYEVTVTERDDSYMVQVREESGELVDRKYVESEDPLGDLPETGEELYDIVRRDILEEP